MLRSFLAALLLHSSAAAAPNQQPPHLIFALIDDWGHGDVGYNNRHFENLLRTPNIDSLASNGITLTAYYVQVRGYRKTGPDLTLLSLENPADLHADAVDATQRAPSDPHWPPALHHSRGLTRIGLGQPGQCGLCLGA